jgi:hypothetical protein
MLKYEALLKDWYSRERIRLLKKNGVYATESPWGKGPDENKTALSRFDRLKSPRQYEGKLSITDALLAVTETLSMIGAVSSRIQGFLNLRNSGRM